MPDDDSAETPAIPGEPGGEGGTAANGDADAGSVPATEVSPPATPQARPAGLCKSVLDFILRNSLLWSAGAMFFGVLVFFLPAEWFGGDPWGGGDENMKAGMLQMLIAMAFGVVALARTGFSERDRERPFWLLALKAVGLFIFYFILAVVGCMLLLLTGLGLFAIVLAVPALLVLGLRAGRKGGTPKEISDRKARRYALAIIFTVIVVAVAIPSVRRSPMAANESATIDWLHGFHDSLRGSEPTEKAFDEAAAGWPKHEDGSPAWFGFYVQVMDLPNFGGKCVVAHPTRYNRSGLNTFVLAPNGTIFQRDLCYNEEYRDKPESWDPNSPDEYWIVCQ